MRIPVLDACAVSDQNSSNFGLASSSRLVQRCSAGRILGLDIGPVREQKLNHGPAAPVGGQVQRRRT